MTTLVPRFTFPPLKDVRERMRALYAVNDESIPHSNLAPRPGQTPPGATLYPPSQSLLSHRGRTVTRVDETNWTISSPSPNWRWKLVMPHNPTIEFVVQGEVLQPREDVNLANFPMLSDEEKFSLATIPVVQHPDLGEMAEDLVDMNGPWWEDYPEAFSVLHIHSPNTIGQPKGSLGFYGGLNVAITFIEALECAYGVSEQDEPTLAPPAEVPANVQALPADDELDGLDELDEVLTMVATTRKAVKDSKVSIPARRAEAENLRQQAAEIDRAADEDEAKSESVRSELREQAEKLVALLKADEDFPWEG